MQFALSLRTHCRLMRYESSSVAPPEGTTNTLKLPRAPHERGSTPPSRQAATTQTPGRAATPSLHAESPSLHAAGPPRATPRRAADTSHSTQVIRTNREARPERNPRTNSQSAGQQTSPTHEAYIQQLREASRPFGKNKCSVCRQSRLSWLSVDFAV